MLSLAISDAGIESPSIHQQLGLQALQFLRRNFWQPIFRLPFQVI